MRISMEVNSAAKPGPRKKPYRAPSLQQYGDLARITRTVGRTGADDGGKGNMNKTS